MRPLEPLDIGPRKTDQRPTKPTRSRIPAGLLSLLLHVGCLLLALSLFRFQPTGGSHQDHRSGGIVLVESGGEPPQYFDTLETAESQTRPVNQQLQGSQNTNRSLAGSRSVARDLSLPGSLPASDQPVSGTGESVELPAVDGLLQARQSQQTTGYNVQTGIFGLQGEGTRFVYVFDRSGSMAGFQGRPLASAKSQLLASLADLGSTHQFQIVFYADRPSIFNPRSQQPARMVFADEATKRVAQAWVRGVVADGSTRHLEALLLAVRMRPDVIFFLTDAEEPHMTSAELEKVQRTNRRVGASIHTIEFGTGSIQREDSFLVRLARANGGQHTYVDVTRLRPRQ